MLFRSLGVSLKYRFGFDDSLDVVVPDDMAESTLSVIADAARTGTIGDGKAWATEVTDAVRVRTGEVGDAALR